MTKGEGTKGSAPRTGSSELQGVWREETVMSEKEKRSKPRFQVSDRRFWVRDESAVEDARIPEPRYPSFVEELVWHCE